MWGAPIGFSEDVPCEPFFLSLQRLSATVVDGTAEILCHCCPEAS